eukprot:gene45158-10523_t
MPVAEYGASSGGTPRPDAVIPLTSCNKCRTDPSPTGGPGGGARRDVRRVGLRVPRGTTPPRVPPPRRPTRGRPRCADPAAGLPTPPLRAAQRTASS